MQKKKNDNFIDKIVRKDYNNELEKVLEKKYFNENVKSVLLNMFYKIEIGYKDYKKVKQDVETKDELIQRIIQEIKNNCETIKLVQPNSEESKIIGNKTFLVEKNKKRIICYPIERKLLYCIAKISKNNEIIKENYFLINKTLSNLLNVGNNINTVEVMRDFNGYSWTTIPREIESIKHNLIYQVLRILVGNEFLNKWIYNKEYIIDYLEIFEENITKNYGKVEGTELIEGLKQLSVLMDVRYDKNSKKEILKIKKEIEQELNQLEDSRKFVQELTNKKVDLTKKIKHIDETINNQKMLKQEYQKRNESLPLNEKIFSIRILSKMLEEERDTYIEEIEKLNNKLNPQKYLSYRKNIETKEKYLILLDSENIDKEIDKLIINMQKQFLKFYELKLKRAQTKQEIIDMIYEFRYYCMIPYNEEKTIDQVKNLQKEIEKVQRQLIQKAGQLKVINVFSKKEELNYKMVKNIFHNRIINLEQVCIKVTKENDQFYVQLFDENVFEEKDSFGNINDISKKDLEIRINKKVKIFL